MFWLVASCYDNGACHNCVMSCHVTQCDGMLRHVMAVARVTTGSRYVMFCRVMSCYVMFIVLCHVHQFMLCSAMLWHVMSCYDKGVCRNCVMLCNVMSCSCHVLACCVML